MTEKRYRLHIEVTTAPSSVNSIARLLPGLLREAGFTVVGGVTSVEAWVVEETEKLGKQPGIARSGFYEAEHRGR